MMKVLLRKIKLGAVELTAVVVVGSLLVASLITAATAEPQETGPVRLCPTYPNAMFHPDGVDALTGINHIVAIDLRGVTGEMQLPPGRFERIAGGVVWRLDSAIACRWTVPR